MSTTVASGRQFWRIVAQDPSVKWRGRMLTAMVEVYQGNLEPGPRGHRVNVVDFDASTATQYLPAAIDPDGDVYARADDERLLTDPAFHSRNAFAIAMRTLERFERALGRRVTWGSGGHQLYLVPHAFADANAFYSRADHALLFGYFPARRRRKDEAPRTVFTCLSHDIVAHETAHALLDGLRERFMDPASKDQAAFHEGFADIVALLSVFSLPDVVDKVLGITTEREQLRLRTDSGHALLPKKGLTFEALAKTGLLGLADQMGQELEHVRGGALRRSVELKPSKHWYTDAEFEEPHRRGELLVAAVMRAFLLAWTGRIHNPADTRPDVDRAKVVEDGADIAELLLTMAIRGLDYCPPVEIEFPDYLSALLTADTELRADDSRYDLRNLLRRSFADFGIEPASNCEGQGLWSAPQSVLRYHRTHFESMQRDPQEVFGLVWENRSALHLDRSAYTRVLSVRPCVRVAPDGFVLRETVAEVHQTIDLVAGELARRRIELPEDMPREQHVTLYGGSTLVFDEYGRLKFEIHKRLDDVRRQSRRLKNLWADERDDVGTERAIGRTSDSSRLHLIHRRRATPWRRRAPSGGLL